MPGYSTHTALSVTQSLFQCDLKHADNPPGIPLPPTPIPARASYPDRSAHHPRHSERSEESLFSAPKLSTNHCRASGDAGVCSSRHVAPISVKAQLELSLINSPRNNPKNNIVPRSRSPLPQAVRDAERRTGESGVALLAGVRGENSPHYTKRPRKRKSSTKKMREIRQDF